MTRAGLAIKKSILIIVVLISVVGFTAMLNKVSISIQIVPKRQQKPTSSQTEQRDEANGGNRIGDPISLLTQNPKGELIRISLPSGTMIENADHEMMTNSTASFRAWMVRVPAHYFESSDEQMNKIFATENLPLSRFSNLIELKKADDEINRLFILGNTKILVDQKMFVSADNSMIRLFECSSQYTVNMVNPFLLLKADVEITRDFKENISINNNQANAVQANTAKA